MINLLNNAENNRLEFNLNVEGVDSEELDIRMLMFFENHQNYLFNGRVEDGKVVVDLPVFKNITEGEVGQLKLEVIAGSEYFQAWDSRFTIKTKTTVKITESNVIQKDETPVKRISLNLVPVNEVKKEVKAEAKAEAKPEAKAPEVPLPPVVNKVVKESIKPVAPVTQPVKQPTTPVEDTLTFGAFLESRE